MGFQRPASGHQAHPEGCLTVSTDKLLIYLSRVRVPEGALKVLVLQKEAAGLVLFSCVYGDFRDSRTDGRGGKTRSGRSI